MKHLLFLICILLCVPGAFAAKKTTKAPLVQALDVTYTTTHGLENQHIALWGSHGLYYNAEQDRWKWQRARVWTTVEDLFATSFVAPYLVPMLENAGAVITQPRAYVRPGYQTVYVRWMEQNKKPLQIVSIIQGYDTLRYQVNTAMGIGVWHYLCTLPKGQCDIQGAETMILDETTLGPSGKARYMEAARYWVPFTGVPDDAWVTDSTFTDYLNDIVIRGGWANYLYDHQVPLDLCLAIHTDAGTTMNDSLIGSLAIYTNKNSGTLADSVLKQFVTDIRALYSEDWTNRGVRKANYGETRIPQMPSMILEMCSHQNYADMRYALDPHFRFDAARAIYKGVGRWLGAKNKNHFIPQPLAPMALRTSLKGDSIVLTWQPRQDEIEPEATPTYYIVYTRVNNGLWNKGERVEQPSMTIYAKRGLQYDFCVAAGNQGGISFQSTIVSASKGWDKQPPVFIVDAFDEVCDARMMAFDSLTGGIVPGTRPIPDGLEMAYIGHQINYRRDDPWHSDDDCGFGMSSMQFTGQLLVGNTHDYTAQHGKVLQNLHRSYVSCTYDALCMTDSVYRDIDVVMGKSNRIRVRQMNKWISDLGWTDSLHHVLLSGAYIGYPSTACASGRIQMGNEEWSFSQELNTNRLSAEDVSGLSKLSPSDTIVARYSDTGLPAIIRNTTYTIVGFPLETLNDFETIYTLFMQR